MKKQDRKYFEKVEEIMKQKNYNKIHRVSGASIKKIAKLIISKKK